MEWRPMISSTFFDGVQADMTTVVGGVLGLTLIIFGLVMLVWTIGTTEKKPPLHPLFSPGKDSTPKSYVMPRISRTDALMKVRTAKSCQEYLPICERSCKERGTIFNFSFIGQEFQPLEEHSRCLCADDLYSKRQTSKQDRIQVTQEQEQ